MSKTRAQKLGITLAVGVLLVLLPQLLPSTYTLRVANTVGMYIILCLGLNVVVGLAGLLDLGYVGFFAIGGYTYALLASPHMQMHYSFWLIMPLGAALAALFGVLLGIPVLRLRGDYLAIVTMGFGEIIRLLMLNLDKPVNITNGPNGLTRIDPPKLFGQPLISQEAMFYVILAFALLGLFTYYGLEHSRLGRTWKAIREDELAARSMGVNVPGYKLWAFALGSMFAGVAGVILAGWQNSVFPSNFELSELINIFAMTTIGGTGSIVGAVLGASILVVVPEFMRQLAQYRMLAYGPALVLIMIYAPQGLAGLRFNWRRFGRRAQPASVEPHDVAALPALPAPTRAAIGDDPGAEVRAAAQWSTPPSGQPLLQTVGLSKRFGGLNAVQDINLKVFPGEIVSIIGPNGAGKSTLFNLITGVIKPSDGTVLLGAKDVTSLRANQLAALGVARTFQNLRLFNEMTVLENVMVGAHTLLSAGVWDAVLRLPRGGNEETALKRRALRLLAFMGEDLVASAQMPANSLPYAHRRRLEIARALAAEPRILLLDEPAAGMNAGEIEQLIGLIARIRDHGITVVLVEHHMPVVMSISDRIMVMDHGAHIAEGTPEEIRTNPDVIDAYLGRQAHQEDEDSVAVQPAVMPAPAPNAGETRPMLAVEQVEAGYGQVSVLRRVSLEVYPGEIVCLLGANGAGKSTTLKTVMGTVRPTQGRVQLHGTPVGRRPTSDIVRAGVALVPEGRRIFYRLSVRENLELGSFTRQDAQHRRDTLAHIFELFPRLKEREHQIAGTLSGGEQQMLAIGRALMSGPRLLLLDEPSMGLAPILVEQLFDAIVKINREGTTVLMVEQNANLALQIAHRGYVMAGGAIVLADDAPRLRAHAEVRRAYMGA